MYGRLLVFRFWPICVAVLMCCGVASGQSADAELIRRLFDRVEQLERRVAELEGAKAGQVLPEAKKAAEAPKPVPIPSDIHHGDPPVVTEGSLQQPLLQIAGFSDVNFAASDDPRTRSGFSEGQFILHMTSQLSPRVNFFGELSFTARPDAGMGVPPAPGFNMEVERSIIRYAQSDSLKLSFGRYHTPINYWNTSYHHGAWLQTTAFRPEVAQFGGSFIPVHFVGALVEGSTGAGGLNLNYSAGTGNGRGSVWSRGGDFGDINNNKAWLASGFIRPDAFYGLQVGGAIYRDKLTQPGTPEVREWIQSAHVVWDRENPELIAEFTNVRHQPASGGVVSNSQSYYAQLAWRLNAWGRKFKPYYRYEYIHIPKSDFAFQTVPDLNGSTLGIRYDLTAFSALKFEYRRLKRSNMPWFNGLVMQTSFAF
jgi:hypothetical protein